MSVPQYILQQYLYNIFSVILAYDWLLTSTLEGDYCGYCENLCDAQFIIPFIHIS